MKKLPALGLMLLLSGIVCLTASGEGKLVNLAQLEGVTYEVSAGSHWADHSTDDYNIKLVDGITDSGNKYVVCYDFFRQPDEEKYVVIDFNLKKSYELKKIVLWAKNHTELFSVKSVSFFASNDGLDFNLIGQVPAEGEELKQPVSGKFSIEQAVEGKARFVRLVVNTRNYTNLEEVEIFGIATGETVAAAHKAPATPVIKPEVKVSTAAGSINLARVQGVSYEVAAGSYWADHSTDKYNTLLTDGVLNSGNKTVVCYDFFRQADEEKYVTVNMDLKKRRKLERIVLHGLNHSELYNIVRCLFEVSSDGIDYQTVADLSEDQLPQKIGTWNVEIKTDELARFVRVTTWTSHWLNLEEVEVFGKE
jgi:hypothetical protein